MSESVYPITESLRSELEQINEDAAPGSRLPDSIKMMVDTVGEYEHGTADIRDVFNPEDIEWLEQHLTEQMPDGLLLRMAACVVQDLGTTFLVS